MHRTAKWGGDGVKTGLEGVRQEMGRLRRAKVTCARVKSQPAKAASAQPLPLASQTQRVRLY